MEINLDRCVDLVISGAPVSPVPVGKLVCIGRNYARHAAEMKSAVPTRPMVFLKPATALIRSGSAIEIPNNIGEVHHEVELVVVVGRRLRHASVDAAMRAVGGYAVGLDMTARDIQAEAKRSGGPWSVAKGYDTFAPLGPVAPPDSIDPSQAVVRLTINGKTVQEGRTSDMVFPVAELLAFCSEIFTLEPGDLLFTGTPEGVGPVAIGDRLRAEVEGLPPLDVVVQAA